MDAWRQHGGRHGEDERGGKLTINFRERTVMHLRKRYHPLHKLRRNRLFRTAAHRFDRSITVRLRNVDCPVRIRLLRDATYWLTPQTPEPEIVALFLALQRVLRPKVFWDIGANIGLYGWLMRSLDRHMQIVMIEPDPTNYQLLTETRSRTSWLGDVDIRQAAISGKNGWVTFAVDEASGATGTVQTEALSVSEEHHEVTAPIIRVQSIALDDVDAANPPDLVKIDTEGHETYAIAGGMTLLEATHPVLIIECFDQNSPALANLRDLGYLLFDAERIELFRAGQTTRDTTNFLALPPKRVSLLTDIEMAWKASLDQMQVR